MRRSGSFPGHITVRKQHNPGKKNYLHSVLIIRYTVFPAGKNIRFTVIVQSYAWPEPVCTMSTVSGVTAGDCILYK